RRPERRERRGRPPRLGRRHPSPATELRRRRRHGRSCAMTDTPSLPEHLTTSEREALFPLPDPALAGLRARLVQQADDAGLVEVAYRTLHTPVSPLLLAATAQGLLRVAFDREDFGAVLAAPAARVRPRVPAAPRRPAAPAGELAE